MHLGFTQAKTHQQPAGSISVKVCAAVVAITTKSVSRRNWHDAFILQVYDVLEILRMESSAALEVKST